MLIRGRSPDSSARCDVPCRWAPTLATVGGPRPRWLAPIAQRRPSARTRHIAGQRICIGLTSKVAHVNGVYAILSLFTEVVPAESFVRSRIRRQTGEPKCRSNWCIGSVPQLRRYRCMPASSNHLTAGWVCVAPKNGSWCRKFLLSHLGATTSALPYPDELKATNRMVLADSSSCRNLSPLDLFSEQFRLKYMIDAERCRGNRQFSCQPAKTPYDGRFCVEVDAQCDLPGVFVDAVRIKEHFCDVSLAERVRHGFLHRHPGYRYGMRRDGLSKDANVTYGGGIQIQSTRIVGCERSDHHRRCAHMQPVRIHRPRPSCRVYIAVWASHFKARVRAPTSAKLYVAARGPAKRRAALPMTTGARSPESYASRYLHFEQRDPVRAEARSVEYFTGTSKDSQDGQLNLDRSGNCGQRLNSTTAPYQFGFSFVVRYPRSYGSSGSGVVTSPISTPTGYEIPPSPEKSHTARIGLLR